MLIWRFKVACLHQIGLTLRPMSSTWGEEGLSHVEEDPNPEIKVFFDMIATTEKPFYDGCQSSLFISCGKNNKSQV